MAGLWGKDVDALVEEAVRQYLDAAAITDVSSDDVAATQASLLSEMGHIATGELDRAINHALGVSE